MEQNLIKMNQKKHPNQWQFKFLTEFREDSCGHEESFLHFVLYGAARAGAKLPSGLPPPDKTIVYHMRLRMH
jgi:hypothetical protein